MDPIGFVGGNWNLYTYCHNDPINYTDIMGLNPRVEFCKSLLEKIRNIKKKIEQSERELKEDPLGLPKSCPGDDKKPCLSRSGNQRLINIDKRNLAVREAQYLAFCGGFPPNGVPAEGESWFSWKYWEEITCLTGTALVVYVIISEGSRVCPARNLVPVP